MCVGYRYSFCFHYLICFYVCVCVRGTLWSWWGNPLVGWHVARMTPNMPTWRCSQVNNTHTPPPHNTLLSPLVPLSEISHHTAVMASPEQTQQAAACRKIPYTRALEYFHTILLIKIIIKKQVGNHYHYHCCENQKYFVRNELPDINDLS